MASCFRLLVVGGVVFSLARAAERLTGDGREFTINQKNFHVATFSLYEELFDDTYGFVSPDYLPLDNRGYAEILEHCDFEKNSMPLSTYSSLGTLNYYPDTTSYDTFKGYDLVPENKDNYVSGGDFALYLNFKDGKRKFYDQTIMMGQCRLPQEDGGAWHVQRVGPIISTGGYDWWQIAYPDVGFLSEALEKHPEGIDIVKEILVPVKKDGTRLNYPPIHTHHIHLSGPNGVRPRVNMRPMCLHKTGLGIDSWDEWIREKRCYNLSMFFEQHGDYICQPEDDGLDCLTQGDKSPRRLTQAIDLEGELNDVRPFNSEPLEWYYMAAFRWRPIDKSKDPISQMFLQGPGYIFPPSQLTKSFTYPAPTEAQSVMTYTAKLLVSGELIRMKMHGHSAIFESAMMLRGVPSDFGIGDSKFIPPLAYNAVITTDLGFRDNDHLAEHILFHMRSSQDTFDAECVTKKSLRNPICLRPRPDLICVAAVDTAQVAFEGVDYDFDRRPKTWCKPWTFHAGDDFTAVGFNKQVTKPPSPAYSDQIPKFINQHLSFILSYDHSGSGHSESDVALHSHNGPFYYFHLKMSPPMLAARSVAVIFWGSPPIYADTLDVLAWFFTALFTAIAVGIVYAMLWGLRKIPAVDQVVLAVTSTASEVMAGAAAATVGVAKKDHAYEMVSAKEEDDDGVQGEHRYFENMYQSKR